MPESFRQELAQLPALFHTGDARSVIVRGPQHNGRRTMLGAVARSLGRGVLEISDLTRPDEERWKQAGLLATALHALPVVVCDLGPGETADIPRAGGYDGPIGVAIGRSGGVGGTVGDRALSFVLPMPDVHARREHWTRGLDARSTSSANGSG